MITVEMQANRKSLISAGEEPGVDLGVEDWPLRCTLLELVRSCNLVRELFGRHLITASNEARQGWTCSGYENMTRTTIEARPMVVEMDGVYCAMMFPSTLSPNVR